MNGHRLRGMLVFALGLAAVLMPLAIGDWVLTLLGLLLLVSGGCELGETLSTSDRRLRASDYVGGALSTLAGLLLLTRPDLVVGAMLTLLAVYFAAGGATRIAAAAFGRDSSRLWRAVSGFVDVALGAFVWSQRSSLPVFVLGIAIGLHLLSRGWAMLLAEEIPGVEPDDSAASHPDGLLRLSPNETLRHLCEAAATAEAARAPVDRRWCSVLIVLFFFIHVGRTAAEWTWLGMISPFVATAGDVASAVLLGLLLLLPARLAWRKLTRPIERSAWRHRLQGGSPGSDLGERLVRLWLDQRLAFALRLKEARRSLRTSVWYGLKLGLPVIAVLIAVNPIWGFSWYFNTENWASGFWQSVAARRTDVWRAAMIEAVLRQERADRPTEAGLFEVHPSGVEGDRDFTFLVIGDPGEGDESQQSLRDRYLEIGRHPDVAFLVISSDVIYPDGAMKDYEPNFYLPFKGFRQPIYGLPGNHDWFNALDAFNANFLVPGAARVAMRARAATDHHLTSTTDARIDERIAEAARLRREFGVRTGEQRAPFFELGSDRFALIVVDTGVVRTIDPLQQAWLESALERSRGRFTMVILGHPLYAGGHDQGAADPAFGKIHELVRRYEVPVVMAGDTHDFEYYREDYTSATGPRVMHHFVNGGGGAYLSIGTALDWPAHPATPAWAFYPRTAAVRAKLDRETPPWKRPVWLWVKRLGAWPVSVEAMSAVFDFNRAPFFQSFVEVQVKPSSEIVRFVVHGANGPLHWRDLQTGGQVIPDGAHPDDPVEFVVPIGAPSIH